MDKEYSDVLEGKEAVCLGSQSGEQWGPIPLGVPRLEKKKGAAKTSTLEAPNVGRSLLSTWLGWV